MLLNTSNKVLSYLIRQQKNAKGLTRLLNSSLNFSTGNNSNLQLFGDTASPPVRFVLMTATYLKIPIDFQKIDLFQNEQKSEFYKKINPLQKVPSLIVDDEIIRDSHAIAMYLCRCVKDSDLYPEEKLKRAKVDEMLFFNSSELFPVDSALLSSFFANTWEDTDLRIEKWTSLLDYLENKLHYHKWLAGEKMTLCDLCCAATISSVNLIIPLKDDQIEIRKWMKKMEALPCYDINKEGLKRLNHFIVRMKQLYYDYDNKL